MVYDVNGHEYATYPVIGFMKRGDCSFGYVNPRVSEFFKNHSLKSRLPSLSTDSKKTKKHSLTHSPFLDQPLDPRWFYHQIVSLTLHLSFQFYIIIFSSRPSLSLSESLVSFFFFFSSNTLE